MNSANSHCFNCGQQMESDCNFCPSCGSVKKATQTPPVATEPHRWMKDSALTASPPASGPSIQAAPATQIQYVPYAVSAPSQVAGTQNLGLSGAVRTMSVVAISLMLVGFIPCLGWLNYLNLVFSFVTIVLCIIALVSARTDAERSSAFIALALVVVAICMGIARLILGGGCL